MNKEQIDQIVEEVRGEFFTDTHFSQSYYGHFISHSDQHQLDDYYLFTALSRNALLDAFLEVRQWSKAQKKDELLSQAMGMDELESVARSFGADLGTLTSKYLSLGYRRGYTKQTVTTKKEADQAWDDLLETPPLPEEAMLTGNYNLSELEERIIAMSMTHSAHWLAHHGHGFDWSTLCGGFCFGVLTVCMQAWTFGGRVSEMVLLHEGMQFEMEEGEPDGQETEKEESNGS